MVNKVSYSVSGPYGLPLKRTYLLAQAPFAQAPAAQILQYLPSEPSASHRESWENPRRLKPELDTQGVAYSVSPPFEFSTRDFQCVVSETKLCHGDVEASETQCTLRPSQAQPSQFEYLES